MTREEFGKLLNFSKDFVPAEKRNRPGTKITPAFITIHNTGNAKKGADASAHANFVTKTGHYVNGKSGKVTWASWHYTVCIVTHLKWTSKKCPQLLLDKGKLGSKWTQFVDLVRQQAKQITA